MLAHYMHIFVGVNLGGSSTHSSSERSSKLVLVSVFFCLAAMLGSRDPALAQFYESLLKAEARHFKDYLGLGAALVETSTEERAELLLERERELILGPDGEIRFHSGIPG